MSTLEPGPELDAKVAEWVGWPACGGWEFSPSRVFDADWRRDYGKCPHHPDIKCYPSQAPPAISRHDAWLGEVLDTLVAKGYEPALAYSREHEGWRLTVFQLDDDGYWRTRSPYEWQPTRPLAVCAAVVGLMEEQRDGE